jgi:dolichyl-phosphate beta-glucosyltransferase
VLSIRTLVVIPAYNEAAKLPILLADIKAYLDSPLPAEGCFDIHFLIVDDGSRREEFAATERLLREYGLQDGVGLVRLERNRGKGAAIRAGFERGLAGSFQYLAFMDADSSVSVSELHHLLVYLTTTGRPLGLAGAIGSRVRMLGRTVVRSPLRHCVGRVFATFVTAYFGCAVYDTQCGLKVFETDALRRYLRVPTDDRWVWDTELLLAMLHGGERIHEIPINWRETGQSKVSLIRDPLRMFWNLVKFKRRLLTVGPSNGSGPVPHPND